MIPHLPRAAWLAVGVAAGAAAGAAGWPVVAAIAGLLVVAAGQARGVVAAQCRHPATAAGIGAVLVAARLVLGPSATPPPPLPDGGGPWQATVESVGSPRDGDQVARLRLRTEAGEVLVAATLPAFPVLTAGSLVEVDGRLRPPPADDPYGEYLRRTGASGSLDARTVHEIEAPGFSLQVARDGAGDALRLALPEPEAGLAAGILIGLRERVDRILAADFATAGVSHVVAISGWNIAIVAGLVGAVLRGRPRRLVSVAVLGTVTAYVVAAGGSPSVVRAAVMAGVVLLARESGRAGRAAAALGVAASVLLLLDPALIGDAGFRLSVMATAGLLAWANPVGAWLGGLGGGRVPRWLAESLGISLAAQAATLPDVVATFGRLSLVSPLVNLAVVPLVPVAMAAGMLALVAGAASAAGAPALVATLVGLPGWLVLHVIIWLVRIGAGLPFAAVSLPPAVAMPVSLGTAVAVVAAPALLRKTGVRRRRRAAATALPAGRPTSSVAASHRSPVPLPRLTPVRRAMIVGALIIATLGGAAVGEATGRTTRITVLDVGQGDAILIETRTGARMLVDGGPDPARVLVALDARIPPWDRRLDLLVLTHPHEDHVAGLTRILERYRVGRVFEPGMRGPGPGWAAWSALVRDGPPHGVLLTGAQLRLGEVSMRVLWPDAGAVPLDPPNGGTAINNVSIVLLGEANGRRFLLAGDIEDGIDPTLLARGLPRVDFLKVAHHGSRTATTQAFVDAVRPRVAVASAGAGNTYGHPAPSTLARLREAGARVLRTDLDGSVSVELLPSGLAVATTGPRAASTPVLRLARTTTREPAPRPAPQRDAFACAIPVPAGSPLRQVGRPAAGAPAGLAVAGSGDWALATGYDRGHDDPRSPRGRPPAALARAARLVPPALVRGRRRRGLAGTACTRGWSADRWRSRGSRRPAPRHRQAAVGARRRSPPR